MYLTNFRIKNNRKTEILTGLKGRHPPAVTQKGSGVFLSDSEKMLSVMCRQYANLEDRK